ncbi:hypothetical protein TRIUR3_06177 [Triticum urartu]|uniref:Uncharacterized protein n=1 Tax=Triticum urartu TaxID=4572 RepID=M7Z591_TRIUA|nr:hypothetical protein TRIUR3_06177 [Triticum urartu]
MDEEFSPLSPSLFLDLPPTPPPAADVDLDFISRMLMEEDIDDKFFYQYPDQPAILDAQRPYQQIISDTTTTSSGSPNGTTSSCSPNGTTFSDGNAMSSSNAATSSSEETNNFSWPYDPLELSQLLRSPPYLDDMLFGGLVPDSPADEDTRNSFVADAPAAGFQQSPPQFKGAANGAGAFFGQNGGSPGTQSSAVLNGPAEEKEAERKPAMFSAGDGGQGGLLSAFFSNGGDMDMLNSACLKGMEEANKFLPTNNTLLEAIPGKEKERGFIVKKEEAANGTPTSGNGRRGRKYRYEEDDLDAETARSSKLMMPDSEETGAREMFDEIMLEGYETCMRGIEELRLAMDSEAKKKNGKAARAKKSEVVDLRTMLIHCAQAVAAGDRRGATELLRQIKQHSGPTGDATQRLAHCFAEGLEARLAGTGSQVYQSLVAKRTSVVEFLKAYKLFMAACCFKKANFGSCARELGVPFKFHGVAAKWDTVRGEDLRIDPDEVLVVHCQCGLRNLMDDSVAVTTSSSSPRDVVLRNIRDMKPDVFVECVANGGYGAPFFVTRFREALFFYSAHFDILDATIPRDNDERLMIERDLIGRGALNVIACEGADRVLTGGVKKWSDIISTASTAVGLDGMAQRDLGDGCAQDGCDVSRRGTTRSRLKDGMSSWIDNARIIIELYHFLPSDF